MNILILNTIINNLQKNNRMNDKKMTKSMILKGVTAAICITAILLAGCSTVYEEKMVYNNIEIPFKNDFPTDTVTYDKLRAEHTPNPPEPERSFIKNREQGRLHFPYRPTCYRNRGGRGRLAPHHQLVGKDYS